MNDFKSFFNCFFPIDSNLELPIFKDKININILIAFGATFIILFALILMCSIYRKQRKNLKIPSKSSIELMKRLELNRKSSKLRSRSSKFRLRSSSKPSTRSRSRSKAKSKYQLKAHTKDQLTKKSELSTARRNSKHSKLLKIKAIEVTKAIKAIKSKTPDVFSEFIIPEATNLKEITIKDNFSQFATPQATSPKRSAIASKLSNNFSQLLNPEEINLKESTISNDFFSMHQPTINKEEKKFSNHQQNKQSNLSPNELKLEKLGDF